MIERLLDIEVTECSTVIEEYFASLHHDWLQSSLSCNEPVKTKPFVLEYQAPFICR
jgi:hypothetical protein